MLTTLLSAKGQLVLPVAVRNRRAWPAGTRFEVVETEAGVLLKPLAEPPAFAATTLDQVFGMARYTGPARSLADMDAAVLAQASKRG